MKQRVIKRSVYIGGKKTSVSLEDRFWTGLKEIAAERNSSIRQMMIELSEIRDGAANFSSCIRLFVLEHYMTLADDRGAILARIVPEPPAAPDVEPGHV